MTPETRVKMYCDSIRDGCLILKQLRFMRLAEFAGIVLSSRLREIDALVWDLLDEISSDFAARREKNEENFPKRRER